MSDSTTTDQDLQSKLPESPQLPDLPLTLPTSIPSSDTNCVLSPCSDGSQDLTMMYEGREYSFVEEVPVDYICDICSKIFTEPHLTECCGQHYCRSCIEQWLQANLSQTCPHCRSSSFTHIQDKFLERKVRELTVLCTNSSHGCEWNGSLFDVQSHLNSCTHAGIECSNGCGMILFKREMITHEKQDCKLRLETCRYCSNTFTYKSLISNHLLTCPQVPVSCENCSKKVLRNEMETHLDHECPKVVSICPFADVGCTTLVHRDSSEEHVTTCKDKYLVKAFQKLTTEVATLIHKTKTLQEERDELKVELGQVKKDLHSKDRDLECIRAENDTIRSTVLRELEILHNNQHPHESLALECIKTQFQERTIHLHPYERMATFRLADYSIHKRTGDVWYSPPFYVSHGYKLCLAFHLTGLGAGEGTHTSLCVHQMKGEHDCELKWPYLLQTEFEISVMRQVQLVGSPRVHSGSRATLGSPDQRRSSNSPEPSPNRQRHFFKAQRKAHTLPDTSKGELASPNVHEKEEWQVTKYLSRVNGSSPIGPPIAKLELFCLQNTIDKVVYKDSIVFQCCLKASSFPSDCSISESWDVCSQLRLSRCT